MKSVNLLVVNQAEIASFLEGDRFESIQEAIAPCRVLDADELSAENWREALSECNPEIIVGAWSLPGLPEDVLRELSPALRYLCYLAGAVRDKVTRSLIGEGLIVSNWGTSISRTVAECALLLGLSCMRRTGYWNDQMHHHGRWKKEFTTTQSLFERRVGIHGYGALARAFLKLLKPFTENVKVFSDGVPSEVFERDGVVQSGSLEALFSESDIVFELEALTPQRVGMVDETMLRRLPEDGAFVNVARGALVDEVALVTLAKEGNLQIGLDVYASEPLAEDHPLRGCMNVMLLPHIAGPTSDRFKDAGDHAIGNLQRYRAGEEVVGAITPDVYDRLT